MVWRANWWKLEKFPNNRKPHLPYDFGKGEEAMFCCSYYNIVQFPMSCFQGQHQKDASPMKQKKWAFVLERES